MSGELRRPPQLWEEKLARKTSILSVGVDGDATAIVDTTPTPGTDDGVEPSPTTPAPEDFIAPSTPSLSGTVQGIRVSWDGENVNGDPYPAGAFVEVHISTTGATFTPDATTLAGRLLGSAGFFTIGALTAGTTYYVRLVGVDDAGNRTAASTAASSQTGLTTSSDYGTATIDAGAVSFDARSIGGITTTVGTTAPSSPVTGDIWLDSTGGAIVHKRWSGTAWVTQAWGSSSISTGAVTATQIAAGAVAAGAIAANAITAEKIDANAVTADKINAGAIDGKTITGATIRTASGTGARVVLDSTGLKAYNSSNSERVAISSSTGNITVTGGTITGATITGGTIQTSGGNNQIIIRDDALAGGIDVIEFKAGVSGTVANLYGDATGLICTGQLTVFDDFDVTQNVNVSGSLDGNEDCYFGFSGAQRAIRVGTDGKVFSYGARDNTTSDAANMRVEGTGAQVLRSTSTVRLKDELTPLTDDLESVDAEKLADFPASVDPYDVLAVTPTEFASLCEVDASARLLGFIAEDVAAKFPWAADWDETGQPDAVKDRPILAALLAVVKDQQTTIENLTARIEALEA